MYDHYPVDKIWHKYLPMGVSNSSDLFQQKTNDLFNRFKFIRAYIDKILILTTGDWTDYVQDMELPIKKTKEKGLKCNIEKYFFGHTEMGYLGF